MSHASPSLQNFGRLELLQNSRWARLGWLAHGFSTRPGGVSRVYSTSGAGELNLGFTPADNRECVLQNRERLLRSLAGDADPAAQLKTLSQIHSPLVHAISEIGDVPPGDGMMTATPGFYLAIQTADCVPVLLADERKRVVSAIHAGWRGTVTRIVEVGVERMHADFGSQPAGITALIGPSIGPCCYAVGEELHQEFIAAFSYGKQLFSAKNSESKLYLNLHEANRRQLIDAGLNPESIHQVGGCTSCEPEMYFSHRQSGGQTGRMMSVVGIRSAK